jgi:hypothetical protein
MLSEQDFLELARTRYAELASLEKVANFLDYEEAFDALWVSLGRSVLEQSISQVPTNKRKKKRFKPVTAG